MTPFRFLFVAMVMLLATDTSVESARRTVRDRQVTIPAGTVLRVRLAQSIGSDLSHVEDTVEDRSRVRSRLAAAPFFPRAHPRSESSPTRSDPVA